MQRLFTLVPGITRRPSTTSPFHSARPGATLARVGMVAASGLGVLALILLPGCGPRASAMSGTGGGLVRVIDHEPAQAEKIQLRLHLRPGQTFRARTTMEQEINQTIQGQKVDMQQTLATGCEFHVREVDANGAAVMAVTHRSILFHMTSPTGSVHYDSAEGVPPTDVMGKLMSGLIGQGFTMKVSPEGRVLEVHGLESLVQHVLARADLPPGAVRSQVESSIRTQFGESGIVRAMEQVMAIFPSRPVTVGDTWSKRDRITTGFPMEAETEFTLRDRKHGVATVVVKSRISPSAEPHVAASTPVSFRVSGDQTGTMQLDESTGWIRSAELRQSLSGEAKSSGGAAAGGLTGTWPVAVKSTITFGPM